MPDLSPPALVTDVLIERLEGLLEKSKRRGLSLPGEPAFMIEQDEARRTREALASEAINALPSILASHRHLQAELAEARGTALEEAAKVADWAKTCSEFSRFWKGMTTTNDTLPVSEEHIDSMAHACARKERVEAHERATSSSDIWSDERYMEAFDRHKRELLAALKPSLPDDARVAVARDLQRDAQ